MMVGVTLELEEQEVRQRVRCVPRMTDVDLLVFSALKLVPKKSIVLHVVDTLEQ
jgi:7,8-dihydro-6-hydroxymethylpterin-pyrophosphokinase